MTTARSIGLALAALGLAVGPLRADPALRRTVEGQIMARAAAAGCLAEVWAPALAGLAPEWRLTSLPVLPRAGVWTTLMVPVALIGSTLTARAEVRVRLFASVAAWTPRRALAPGEPLDAATLQSGLFDPRGLAGPAFTGPLPRGAVASRALLPGTALLRVDVSDPSDGRAGQRVDLKIREGCIVADDEGVLLESGPQGSLLRAQHLRSGKIVRGRLDGGTLLVED